MSEAPALACYLKRPPPPPSIFFNLMEFSGENVKNINIGGKRPTIREIRNQPLIKVYLSPTPHLLPRTPPPRPAPRPPTMNLPLLSGFSRTHKIANIGIIANFVFLYICSFLLYLHYVMLVNVTLDISGYKQVIFQN